MTNDITNEEVKEITIDLQKKVNDEEESVYKSEFLVQDDIAFLKRRLLVVESKVRDGIYGSIYNDNNSTTVSIGTSGTFERIPSGFTQGQVNLVTFGNNRELTVIKAGRYKIDYSISFNSDGGAGLDMEGAIGIDGTKNTQGTAHRLIGTGNDIGNMAGTAILDLAANAVISIMMTNNTSTVNIVVTHASLSLTIVGGI